MDAKEAFNAAIARHDLAVTADFVPWSKSRNAKPNPRPSDLSLNWKVTLWAGKRAVLTTDYQAGIAHCPSYKPNASFGRNGFSVQEEESLTRECETGHRALPIIGKRSESMGMPILPDTRDVIASLCGDAEVLGYQGFEDWAENMGLDSDSRKAEKAYQDCMAIALKLRSALGDATLMELQGLAVEL